MIAAMRHEMKDSEEEGWYDVIVQHCCKGEKKARIDIGQRKI